MGNLLVLYALAMLEGGCPSRSRAGPGSRARRRPWNAKGRGGRPCSPWGGRVRPSSARSVCGAPVFAAGYSRWGGPRRAGARRLASCNLFTFLSRHVRRCSVVVGPCPQEAPYGLPPRRDLDAVGQAPLRPWYCLGTAEY